MSDNETPGARVPERLASLFLLAIVVVVCCAAAIALLEWRLGAPMRDRTSLLGAAPLGRTLTYREYPVSSTFWATPSDSAWIYPGGLEARRYEIRTDRDGNIEPSRVHEDPDLSIVFLGGSTTECLFVAPEARFPYLVGRLLEQRTGLKVNALNGGRSGNTSMHASLAFLAKVAPARPQYAVLMENINDLTSLAYFGSYWAPNDPRAFLRDPATVRTGLAGYLRGVADVAIPGIQTTVARMLARLRGPMADDEFGAIRGRQVATDSAAVIAQYRSSLRTFVVTARAWGVEPVLMTQASRMHADGDVAIAEAFARSDSPVPYEVYRTLHRRFNDEMRDVAAELRVPLIELDRTMPTDSTTMYDAVHFTERGSRDVAALIAERLVALAAAAPGLPAK